MSFFTQIYKRFSNRFRKRTSLIHEGEFIAQTRFGTRHQAERLAPNYIHPIIQPDYKKFIEGQTFFFVATSDHHGRCDCSYRGSHEEMLSKGFPTVIVRDERTLLFPDFQGNGLYQSLGNLYMNPHIGMIFINFETRQRVRVNGTAEILEDIVEAQRWFGEKALRMVKVNVEDVYANCPKYINTDTI